MCILTPNNAVRPQLKCLLLGAIIIPSGNTYDFVTVWALSWLLEKFHQCHAYLGFFTYSPAYPSQESGAGASFALLSSANKKRKKGREEENKEEDEEGKKEEDEEGNEEERRKGMKKF